MTSIFEVTPLRSAYAEARSALRDIAEAVMRDGGAWMTRLNVDLGAATVSQTVAVSFARSQELTHFDEVWAIGWAAENATLFPEFNGRLSVKYRKGALAQLEVYGEYTPPPAAGKDFDLVVGHRLASKTCKTLLTELAGLIEVRLSL